MKITATFYSYFKDITGCASVVEDLPPGSTLSDLSARLTARWPKLAGMERCTLMAVGVDYQPPTHVLREGDEVALFPPVQGG